MINIVKQQIQCTYYNNNIEKSKHDLSIAHICYDWAQNVTIPYSPQQVGSIYFKTAYAVHLFGVCKTEGGKNRQINFVIAEDEFPKDVAKGTNTTLNMVYQSIKTFAKDGKKDLHVEEGVLARAQTTLLVLGPWVGTQAITVQQHLRSTFYQGKRRFNLSHLEVTHRERDRD